MTPKDYYYTRFREQFIEFIKKSKAHEHKGEGVYVPIQEFNKENLSHIPREDYMLFCAAFACTILIDQAMYTHFKEDYQTFQKMTLYPKIEYGITNINANPWDITRNRIGLTTLESFLEFFVQDLKEFFTKNKFKAATWEAMRLALLNDPDVVRGSNGEILKRVLENTP